MFNVASVDAAVLDKPKTKLEINTENLISWGNLFQLFSNVIYVLMWPLIALAGVAMDNQLIYGSFMHLDTSLWNIWQIVRNFANYALWLLFLVAILLYNFSPKGKIELWSFVKGISTPKELITKTLIASILIQASRFILMAAIDLSTVLTYTVGAIPTTIIATTDAKEHDTRMLAMNTLLNFWDAWVQKDKLVDEIIINYRTVKKENKDSKYVAACQVVSVWSGDKKQTFVVGRAFESLTGTDEKGKLKLLKMEPGYCVHYGALISFAEFKREPEAQDSNFRQRMRAFVNDVQESSTDQLTKLVEGGMIYPVSLGEVSFSPEKLPSTVTVQYGKQESQHSYKTDGGIGCADVFWFVSPKAKADGGDPKNVQYHCLYNDTDISVSTLIEKGKSMTWPFVSLYSSLLSFSDLKGYQNFGLGQLFIISFINLILGVALFLPLCALVLVLFARIWILWMAIALSPFIVLLHVFQGSLWGNASGDDFFKKYLSISELQKLLLAPVLVSFAVSLSLVFMTHLKNSIGTAQGGLIFKSSEEMQQALHNISGLDVNPDGSIGILGFIKINFDNGLINLAWIITMLFWVAITWFLLFWAIQQTSIGQKIGSSLQNFWEKWISTRPLIPIGPTGLSFNSIKEVADPTTWVLGKYAQKMQDNNVLTLDKIFNTNTNGGNPPSPAIPDSKQMNAFFAQTPSNKIDFRNHFGLQGATTWQFLSTFDKAWDFGLQQTPNAQLSKNQEGLLLASAQNYRDDLIKQAEANKDDPKQLQKLTDDLQLFINNKHINKSSFIKDLQNKAFKIWQKTYRIVEKNGVFVLELQP